MTITIELDDEAARRVRERAEAEHRTPEDFVRRQIESIVAEPKDPLIGAFADDAEILDEIVEDAMRVRETRPWRARDGDGGSAGRGQAMRKRTS